VAVGRLYFLRHGLADRSAYQGGDDRLRPLTAAGKERLVRQGRNLAAMNWQPDLFLTSPLVRARQTAEIVAAELGLPDRVQIEPALACGFCAADLPELLTRHAAASQLVLVGHEPDFSSTVSDLTGGSFVVCKKGSLIRVDLYRLDPPAGELVWLIPPKALAL
jgi:phosphohistidine phosphatase